MDKRIRIGDKLDLEKIDTRLSAGTDKVVIYVSQVLDESDDDKILVAMPFHEGKVIPLSIGQELYAVFYTKTGLFRCQVVVTGRFKKGTLFLMEIALKSELKKIQRREYFRFECRLPIDYRIVGEEEKQSLAAGEAYSLNEHDLEWRSGIILDLSGGGIRFVSPVQEEKESFLEVRFEIGAGEEKQVIYAYASLLRCESNPNNKTLYDNRIMFWKMEKSLREKIIRFIFDEQRKRRIKELGLD